VRPRDIAASIGITDRSAFGIVTDLAAAGYVVKQKHGRRKRLPGPGAPPAAGTRQPPPAIGEVPAFVLGPPPEPADAVQGTERTRAAARRAAAEMR
jgi:hypothetical protein